jgi:hypothetical protein
VAEPDDATAAPGHLNTTVLDAFRSEMDDDELVAELVELFLQESPARLQLGAAQPRGRGAGPLRLMPARPPAGGVSRSQRSWPAVGATFGVATVLEMVSHTASRAGRRMCRRLCNERLAASCRDLQHCGPMNELVRSD